MLLQVWYLLILNHFDKYRNGLFVATCTGEIYKFKLNENRDNFIFDSPHLQDLVANFVKNESGENVVESLDEIEFGNGFGMYHRFKIWS